MTSQDDVAAFRVSLQHLVTLARRALVDLWNSLDPSKPSTVTAAIDAAMPDLVTSYGEIAAMLAAEYYDELRSAASAGGRYSAVMAATVSAEQVLGMSSWAVSPLFWDTPDPEKALARLSNAAQRLVLQPARDTVADSTLGDPAEPRFARVPQGPTTCAFCLLLASRGAVYHSEYTAGDQNKFHDDCDCVVTPVWPDQPLPYDASTLADKYDRARRDAGSGDLKKILAQLRQNEGVA